MKKDAPKDQVTLGPIVGPGGARAVARQRDNRLEIGMVRPLREGQPIPEGVELIRVDNPDCTCGGWQDVETLRGGGPAQVATPAYRDGYDRIFGGKTKVGSA